MVKIQPPVVLVHLNSKGFAPNHNHVLRIKDISKLMNTYAKHITLPVIRLVTLTWTMYFLKSGANAKENDVVTIPKLF